MEKICSLCDINPGEKALVKHIGTHGAMRRRLQDIGLIPDTEVECVGRSPGKNPAAYLIRGAVIAIRNEDCKDVLVLPIEV
ncbi:MAG: ferrous iron transport protein A [Ruminococcaceae bacterium]|nr:ferrous iron transport protein A [Oscillospiraceae bacterium]